MSGSLTHSPADIVRHLLVDQSLGTLPSASGSWPIAAFEELSTPDDTITLYDTDPRMLGRVQPTGRQIEHHGFQVRIRSTSKPSGFTKARAIAIAMDEDISLDEVTISGSVYLVHSIGRVSGVLYLGKEKPNSHRSLFTINATVVLRQTT